MSLSKVVTGFVPSPHLPCPLGTLPTAPGWCSSFPWAGQDWSESCSPRPLLWEEGSLRIPKDPGGSGQLQDPSPGELCPFPEHSNTSHPRRHCQRHLQERHLCHQELPWPRGGSQQEFWSQALCGTGHSWEQRGGRCQHSSASSPNSHPASDPPNKSGSPKIKEVYEGEKPSASRGHENAF